MYIYKIYYYYYYKQFVAQLKNKKCSYFDKRHQQLILDFDIIANMKEKRV